MRVEIAPEPLRRAPGDTSEAAARGKKKERKEDSGILIYTKNGPECFQSSFQGASKVPSTAQVPLEASRAASERSPGGSWDLPGRPRERLGELRGRPGNHFGSILDLRGGGLS